MSRRTSLAPPALGAAAIRWIGLLGLCAAYLQGGLNKLFDFSGALAEMRHFGLEPAMPFAAAVIVTELLGSTMILAGWLRWLGAAWLGAFTLVSTFVANRYWELAAGQERFMTANAFYEHLGLVGGFLLVAWWDLRESR